MLEVMKAYFLRVEDKRRRLTCWADNVVYTDGQLVYILIVVYRLKG